MSKLCRVLSISILPYMAIICVNGNASRNRAAFISDLNSAFSNIYYDLGFKISYEHCISLVVNWVHKAVIALSNICDTLHIT